MSNELSENLTNEIDNILKNEIASRHSYFQLKYFLIGKEPTNQAKMWQCLRELKTRKESLYNLNLEIEETKDQLELIDINITKINSEIPDSSFVEYKTSKCAEDKIKKRQLERRKKAMQVNLLSLNEKNKWLEEECRFFLETFKNIEKIEPLKSFDDLDAQKEYWGEKLTQKLNIKMLTSNQIDSELVETIISLPDDIPIKKQALNTLNLRHAQLVENLTEVTKKLKG